MVLRYKEMSEKLMDEKCFKRSCVSANNVFANIISEIRPIPKIIVEIGTRAGASAAVLASVAEKVYTFDIRYYSATEYIWNKLKVKENISYFIIKNRKEIKEILKDVKFDFAFIDGGHIYKDVRGDFELVKRCGRVLFHDVADRYPDIQRLMREIKGKVIDGFGYWEEK